MGPYSLDRDQLYAQEIVSRGSARYVYATTLSAIIRAISRDIRGLETRFPVPDKGVSKVRLTVLSFVVLETRAFSRILPLILPHPPGHPLIFYP